MRTFLSLGGGVQSSTLFLMSLHGEIETPCEAAIFADTGWERQQTYETVEELRRIGNDHGVPIHIVKSGDIRKDTINPDIRKPAPPVFVKNKYGEIGKLPRQCTREYKIEPVYRKIRELTEKGDEIEVMLGISIDEVQRMKPARVKWLTHIFPLINLRMDRGSCVNWLLDNGYEVPVPSSCIGCPFHSDTIWQSLSDSEIEDAAEFEKGLAEGLKLKSKEIFLHRSGRPISERPFERHNQLILFNEEDEECEGGCFL